MTVSAPAKVKEPSVLTHALGGNSRAAIQFCPQRSILWEVREHTTFRMDTGSFLYDNS
jgi:hypothetical protein